jgi:hypothetical protein
MTVSATDILCHNLLPSLEKASISVNKQLI